MRSEDVRINLLQLLKHDGFSVDINGRSHDCIETAQVVETEDVICMAVREEDAVNPTELLTDGLLPQFECRVDDELAVPRLLWIECRCLGYVGHGWI